MLRSNLARSIILVVAAVVIVAVVLFLRHKPVPTEGTLMPERQVTTSTVEMATTTEHGGVFTVTIQNYKFMPDVLPAVKRGDVIDFINYDPVAHRVYAKGFFGPYTLAPKNGLLELDTSTLAPGTYAYICDIHPSMKGTLTVK